MWKKGKNYIDRKLETYFMSRPNLTDADARLVRSLIRDQMKYGKLTTNKWNLVKKLYDQYQEKGRYG